MENVVYLSELDAHIAEAIEKVNNGVKLARAKGIQAELPAKIDFDLIAVVRWQELAMESGESGVTKETQSGGTTETSSQTSNDESTGSGSKRSDGANEHAQNTKSQQDNYSA